MSAESQRLYRERHPERANASMAKWRRAHPEQAKAAVVKWKREHPEAVRSDHRRWRRENPEKRSAQNAVYQALRRGTMKKGCCQECGAAKVHAHHHNGYADPHRRDIVWLCPVHHSEVHRGKP